MCVRVCVHACLRACLPRCICIWLLCFCVAQVRCACRSLAAFAVGAGAFVLLKSIYIDFYGIISKKNKIFENHSNVNFHGFKKREFVNNKIFESNACLLFLTDDINYSFSTKFCDYIAMKKPIIVFSNNGLTAEYVFSNKIGHSLSFDDNFKHLVTILSSIINPENYYLEFDSNNFNLEKLTLDYLNIFK